jgi:hypothetical protein
LVSIAIEIEEETEGHLPACNRVAMAVALFKKRTVSRARETGVKVELVSLGSTRQASGLLEGGRNSLLESAQEATLTSVPTRGLPRQCNRLD